MFKVTLKEEVFKEYTRRKCSRKQKKVVLFKVPPLDNYDIIRKKN